MADLADFRLGKMLDEKKNRGESRPYLANLNVRWGDFDLADLRQMRFEEDELEDYGLRHGDIVMCEGGEPGRCAIWRDDIPDIVIARTGATVGYAKRLHKRHPEAVFASYLVRLRLKQEIDSVMVGILVESDSYKSFVQSRVGGAAQPNASAPVLAAIDIVIPPTAIQRAFRMLVEPLIDQQETLQLQSQKPREARDLLLPRLMRGEIEL